jgi:hypothetical protein
MRTRGRQIRRKIKPGSLPLFGVQIGTQPLQCGHTQRYATDVKHTALTDCFAYVIRVCRSTNAGQFVSSLKGNFEPERGVYFIMQASPRGNCAADLEAYFMQDISSSLDEWNAGILGLFFCNLFYTGCSNSFCAPDEYNTES